MERYRIEVGYEHGVKPGNIVGAIANEADLESRYIGHIEIFDDFATIDLPADMPKETLHLLKKARVCGRKIDIRRLTDAPVAAEQAAPSAPSPSRPAPRREYAAPGPSRRSRDEEPFATSERPQRAPSRKPRQPNREAGSGDAGRSQRPSAKRSPSDRVRRAAAGAGGQRPAKPGPGAPAGAKRTAGKLSLSRGTGSKAAAGKPGAKKAKPAKRPSRGDKGLFE